MKRFLPAAFLVFLGTVSAADDPPMKEGLWKTHMISTDQPDGKKTENGSSLCRNHEYDAHVREKSKSTLAKCKVNADSWTGNVKTVDTECTVGGTVVRTKGTITINAENSVHSETQATYTPPMGGKGGVISRSDHRDGFAVCGRVSRRSRAGRSDCGGRHETESLEALRFATSTFIGGPKVSWAVGKR